jgi:hypothetical protein
MINSWTGCSFHVWVVEDPSKNEPFDFVNDKERKNELVYRGKVSSHCCRYYVCRWTICAAVGAPTCKKDK